MDILRNFSVITYTLLGLAAVAVIFRLSQMNEPDLGAEWVSPTSSSDDWRPDSSGRSTAANPANGELTAQNNRIDALENLVSQKNDDISSLRADLQNAVSENVSLRDQLESLQQGVVPVGSEGPSGDASDPDAEIIDQLFNEQQQDEVTQLRNQLTESELEIVQLQDEAEQAVNAAWDERAYVQSVASDTIIQAGAAAVPGLVSMLEDENINIRGWAAELLGAIGPDAGDAVPALVDVIASDPDADVRAAAEDALDAIESNGI